MSMSLDECKPYECPDCGELVNPMTDICDCCGWDKYADVEIEEEPDE